MSQTPRGNYSGPVIVDPLTRIEGHLRIETEVKDGIIVSAKSCGTLFRGLEIILKGRDPRDAQHFTQRTCGVCTYTHALASTRALENMIGVEIPKNATYIRNLVMATQFVHDHVIHFYQLQALDYVDVVSALSANPTKAANLAGKYSIKPTSVKELKAVQSKVQTLVDSGQLGPFTNAYFLGGHDAYYLSPEANLVALTHYMQALRLQVEIARSQAIFGGKNPHTQFLVAGGVTCYNSLEKEPLDMYITISKKASEFVTHTYQADLLMIADAYKDWAAIGDGSANFMTFGELPVTESDINSRFFAPGVIFDRDLTQVHDFDPSKIEEHVRHSWYEGDKARTPYNGVTDPLFTFIGDEDRYSWMKAPRYDGLVMETGPLAQVLVSYAKGMPEVRKVADTVLCHLGVGVDAMFSTLGRVAARYIECQVASDYILATFPEFLDNLATDNQIVVNVEVPKSGRGAGFVNAPRGGLSHWLKVEDGVISNFQMVVPSTWNLGPRCSNGLPSAVEQALVGTPIVDPKRPVEILRIVHSYDPCIACAVHVLDAETGESQEFTVL